MYKEVLSGIENISIYPVISFTVFFIFFTVMSIWVIKSRKEDFEDVSRTPLK
jgi:cytochrome c oxidase cbb3-type subunit 4